MIPAVGSGKRKKKIAPSVAPLMAQLNKLLIKNPKLQTCSDQLLHHLNQLCYNKQQKYIAKQAEIVTTTVKQTLIKAIKITAQELLTQIKYNINHRRNTHATKHGNKRTRKRLHTNPTTPHTPHTLPHDTVVAPGCRKAREGEKDNEKGSAEIILASCISDQ